MPIRFRRRIRVRPDGTVSINLSGPERSLVRSVADALMADLQTQQDPSLRRLFPPGYGDDAVREAGYQMMMGDELRQRHLAAIRQLAETVDATSIDATQAALWLQSINAIRLVLGTRLGVTEDTRPFRLHADDPNAREWIAYDFLSLLLNDLVEALML